MGFEIFLFPSMKEQIFVSCSPLGFDPLDRNLMREHVASTTGIALTHQPRPFRVIDHRKRDPASVTQASDVYDAVTLVKLCPVHMTDRS